MSSVPSYSSLFNKRCSLSLMPRQHLLLLHKSVLHSSYVAQYLLTDYSLQCQLETWQDRILTDDRQINNVNELSPYLLALCLYSRGLYLHLDEMGRVFYYQQKMLLNKMDKKLKNLNEQIQLDENILNDWRELLNQFIQIHKKLSESSQIPTSFLLHITPLLSNQISST